LEAKPIGFGRQFPIEIDDLAIDLGGNGGRRQSLADPLGDLPGSSAGWNLFGGLIGQD
jgi:hypothetical protein